jgi:hypothetical protein
MAGLQSIDNYGPVDAVFFEYIFPWIGHIVWTTPGVKLVVWSRGPSLFRIPNWERASLSIQHASLARRATDGTFHVQLAYRIGMRYCPPRGIVGVSSTLHQVLDPTARGWKIEGAEPEDGDIVNTAKGLLSWKGRRGSVVAPSVFPSAPWVRRRLTTMELLGAMDVAAIRIKKALPEERRDGRRNLHSPSRFGLRLSTRRWS